MEHDCLLGNCKFVVKFFFLFFSFLFFKLHLSLSLSFSLLTNYIHLAQVLESVLLPLYLCFDIRNIFILDIFLALSDIFYASNVVLNFSYFAVMSQGLIISNVRDVFSIRVKTFQAIRQLISGFPFYWLMRWWFPSNTLLLHLGHSIRVLRFPDAVYIFKNLETAVTTQNYYLKASTWRSIFHIGKIFAMLILSAHYVASAFYSIASANQYDCDDCEFVWNKTWIQKQIHEGHIEEDGGHVFVWYSRALYWAVATMVVVVIGDVTPVTVQETVYVLVTILIGVLVNAAIIGSLISFMSVTNTMHGKYRRLAEQMQRYAVSNGISSKLQKKIAHCMAYQWESSEWQRWFDRLCEDGLPRSLRLGINRHLGGKLILRCPIFSPLIAAQADANNQNAEVLSSSLPTSAIKRLILSLRFKMYSPGDIIFDSCVRASEMYIVRHGRVEIVAPEIKSYLSSHDSSTKLPEHCILKRG